jgi:SUKH-4 immunity protein
MRICSPSEFASRWPGSLRPVVFSDPPPALPDDCWHLLTGFGLPRELTIYCYNDITLRFSSSATPLSAIWKRDLKRGHKMGDMPCEWIRFWHLADQEYVQGGGWICIEENTGRLVVIDGDCPTPIFLLNSSVRNFYTTLAHFLAWSENTVGGPAETIILREALRSQDCIPQEELEPFWMNFIDSTLDYGPPMNLAVRLGPA